MTARHQRERRSWRLTLRGIRGALTGDMGKHVLPVPRSRKRAPQALRRLGSVVAAFAVVGAISFGSVAPAEAASTGAGYSGITPDGGYLGNYIVPDGSRAYCMDSSADWPSGATGGASVVGSLAMSTGEGLSPAVLQKLNYATANWGQTGDATQAAAVNAYVYAYTSTWAHYNGQGYATGSHYIDGNSAVQAVYNNIWSTTEANAGNVQNASAPSGSMSFSVDNNNYTGSLRVVGMPAGARVNLTLTNGVFTDSGSRTKNGVGNGTYGVRGTPPDGDSHYKISVRGDASVTSGFTYDPNVTIYYTGSQQRVIKAGTTTPYTQSWTMTASDPFERSTVFSPIATSKVDARFVAADGSFADTLKADVAPGSQPWRQFEDGTGLPVVANGTLYYVGANQPTTGALPSDAEVVGTASVTLRGPGSYKAPSVLPADHKPGFYNWVWTITAADQSLIVQANLPENYAWSDQYGLDAETHVVAAQLSATSKVPDEEVGFGHTASDVLTVSLDRGPWPMIDGQPVPAHFQNKTYWVKGDTAPTAGDAIPADAELFHTTDVTVTAPGEYHSDEITAPPTTAGFLVNVWSIVQDGAGAGYFTDWTDGWASEGEVTKVSPPTVSTEAVASVALGDETNDTAIVDGKVPAPYCGSAQPADGATSCPNTVTFAAYLQKDLGEQPVCEAANEVFNTGYVPEADQTPTPNAAQQSTPTPTPTGTPVERDPAFFYNKPVPVDDVGRFPSADVIFKKVGVYYWVATFRTGDGTVINTGECGDQKEKTVVAEDDVVTKATPRVAIGQTGHDTALVTGVVPKNATLEFALYKQTGSTPVCDASNQVTVGKPQPLPGPGEYTSADHTFTEAGTYFWVETVRNARGEITHQGKCGADGETTIVDALAKTGSDIETVPVLLGAFVLVLLGVGAVVYVKVRRQRSATK
ncbi:hypothetical protein [Leifsonia shinshuensis]